MTLERSVSGPEAALEPGAREGDGAPAGTVAPEAAVPTEAVPITTVPAVPAAPVAERAPGEHVPPPTGPGGFPALGGLWVLPVLAVLVTGVVLRFLTVSDLWLDEAQSVAIARLPLAEMPAALREDGAPPLYYLLLHAWMLLFGTSDLAVRSLSGVVSVAALPVTWVLARRLLGSAQAALTALLLLASSPFAIRYATEARMYSLVVLLTALGGLALHRVLAAPGRWPVAALGVVSGLLALTHYWAFYLLAVLGTGLALGGWRGRASVRPGYRRALAGVVSGAVLFMPWLPTFLYQSLHTGTPWATPPSLFALFTTVSDWAGSWAPPGRLLAALFFGLLALGVFGAAAGSGQIVLSLRGRTPGRELAALSFGTLTVAVLVGMVTHGAAAHRYTSMAFLPFLLVLTLGLQSLAVSRVYAWVLAVVVVLGFAGGVNIALTHRTQAGPVAAYLQQHAGPGDVVVYCPDQLGPGVSRLLGSPPGVQQVVYPSGDSPERVNWVDYAERNKAAKAVQFAEEMSRRAGTHSVWVVGAPGYRTLKTKCEILSETLAQLRPRWEVAVRLRPRIFERQYLVEYPWRPGRTPLG